MLVVAQDGSFYEVYSSKARILIFSKENNLSFRCLIHFWVFVRDGYTFMHSCTCILLCIIIRSQF